MAKYFKQSIKTDTTVPRPAYEPFEARQPARKTPLVSLFRAQDRCVTMGRRVLLTQSLRGCAAWLVPDTDPVVASRTHPVAGTARNVAVGRVELTPGHMLRLSVLCGLSGETQSSAFEVDTNGDLALDSYSAKGANGSVIVTITWTDSAGGTESTTHEVDLPPSELEDAASNDGSEGGQWKALRVVELSGIFPENLGTNVARNRWTLGTTVSIALANRGGARIVDACVSEEPLAIAYEAEDTSTRWVSHMLGNAEPGGTPPSITHPYQRLSESVADGDPRGGTWHVQDVANNQALRLGPTLITWGYYDEDDAGITTTEVAGITTTSSTFVGVPNTSITTWSNTQQGWDISAAGYARPYQHNHPSAVGNDGVIPVRFRVYYTCGATTTGVARIQSAADSWVDVALSAGTTGWATAYGYLRCGQGPGDPATTMAFLRRASGANNVTLHYLSLYRSGNFAVAA
jgi:hypothetical protein